MASQRDKTKVESFDSLIACGDLGEWFYKRLEEAATPKQWEALGREEWGKISAALGGALRVLLQPIRDREIMGEEVMAHFLGDMPKDELVPEMTLSDISVSINGVQTWILRSTPALMADEIRRLRNQFCLQARECHRCGLPLTLTDEEDGNFSFMCPGVCDVAEGATGSADLLPHVPPPPPPPPDAHPSGTPLNCGCPFIIAALKEERPEKVVARRGIAGGAPVTACEMIAMLEAGDQSALEYAALLHSVMLSIKRPKMRDGTPTKIAVDETMLGPASDLPPHVHQPLPPSDASDLSVDTASMAALEALSVDPPKPGVRLRAILRVGPGDRADGNHGTDGTSTKPIDRGIGADEPLDGSKRGAGAG